MADVGGPLSYYWRAITNIELAGPFMGYWHILALFSIASAIFLNSIGVVDRASRLNQCVLRSKIHYTTMAF